jgi:hypothetical protein
MYALDGYREFQNNQKYGQPTPRNGYKKRGPGITRKVAHESKARRKMAKESRRRNR